MAYRKETLKKMLELMGATARRYGRMKPEDIKLCVSVGNRKIGRVMNVSLPPVLSCGHCKECKLYCYDVKACMQYPGTVIDARIRNWAILKADRAGYFRRIEERITRRRRNKFFRWHVAGDIIDRDYFDQMVAIAKRHPDFTFWTYTKMYSIINGYIADGGDIPENFHIMFSEWRGLPMDNPYNFPEFRVLFKGETPPAGYYCPGNCDICKANGRGCLAGETTYALEH